MWLDYETHRCGQSSGAAVFMIGWIQSSKLVCSNMCSSISAALHVPCWPMLRPPFVQMSPAPGIISATLHNLAGCCLPTGGRQITMRAEHAMHGFWTLLEWGANTITA
jgi:hypothetical protein